MSGAGTGKLTGCNSTGDILLKGRIMGIFFVCEKQSFTSGPTLMACHEKFGPPPPIMDSLVQIFRNIWTSMELIFQELDEIFRLPLKFLDPSLQRVNNLF